MDELTESYIDGPDLGGGDAEGTDASYGHRPGRRISRPGLAELLEAIENDRRWDRISKRLAIGADRIARGVAGDVLRGEQLGHALHPMLTDLPIGCWTSAALVDAVGGRTGAPSARRLIGLGLLSAIPAALAGAADYSDARSDPVRRVGAAHATGNSIAWGCFAMSWRARRRDHRGRGIAWSSAGCVVLAASGYLGGHLAFARGVGQRHEAAEPHPNKSDLGASSANAISGVEGSSDEGRTTEDPGAIRRPLDAVPGY